MISFRRSGVFFFFILISFSSAAQISVSGIVVDHNTDKQLPFVHVIIFPSGEGATTDTHGRFSLTVNSIDSIQFSHVGYSNLSITSYYEDQIIRMMPLPVQVHEVVVEGFNWKRSLIQSPASIEVIGTTGLQRYNQVSLVQAVNTMPGVRMEERSPGSYRFSIRGSLLRSPFGVRNVKIYWNGIPYTDAGGNTQLNLIDMNSIERVEVIKGPAASMYGAGTGGVVMLKSAGIDSSGSAITYRGVTGSYGLFQNYLEVATATKESAYVISYVHQKREGYRDHSEVDRTMVNISSKFYSRKNTFSVNGFYTDHFYEIPGGIDSVTFAANPLSARPGSESQNSSIRNKTFLLAIGNEWDIQSNLKHNINMYTIHTDFDHPFILDYKRNTELGFGGRTSLSYQFNLATLPAEASTGMEYQNSFVMAKNYENIGGIRDSLILDDEITSQQYFGFLQLDLNMPAGFYFSGGISFNRWSYRFLRASDAPVMNNFSQFRDFNPVVSPRVALLKSISTNHSIHASVSWGFSPPSVVEIRTSEGSLNTDLEAEQGINYEASIKGTLRKTLDYNLTGFSLQLNNTIVSRTSPEGVVLFSNAGNTLQNGIELSAGLKLLDNTTSILNYLRIWSSFSYSHFRFKNYIQNDNDFSENELTGVPANVLVSGLDLRSRMGLYINFTWNYTDKIPLNDANTVYSEPYHLVTGRLGIKRDILNKKLNFDIFGGADNLLNEKYSLGNDLNAFGGRYYQPAAPINFYTGLSLTLNLKKS